MRAEEVGQRSNRLTLVRWHCGHAGTVTILSLWPLRGASASLLMWTQYSSNSGSCLSIFGVLTGVRSPSSKRKLVKPLPRLNWGNLGVAVRAIHYECWWCFYCGGHKVL